MAQQIFFRVHRIDDQKVLQTCREVMEVLEGHDPSGSVQPIPGLSQRIDQLNDDEWAGKYSLNLAQVTANLGGTTSFNLTFTRAIREGNTQVPSALYNEFRCDYGGDANDWRGHLDKALSIQEIIGRQDLLPVGGSEVGQEGVLRELLVGFGAQHRAMLESLDKAIKTAEGRRKELDDEAASKALEQRAAHEEAMAELEKQRAELERQSHMAERRRLLRELTDATGDRVRTSIAPRGAIYARWGVFSTSLLISGCAAWLALTSFSALGTPVLAGGNDVANGMSDAIDWVILIRAIISSLISIGALVYAAAWLRGFYNADLSAAREIERFTYDLNRASWVIETVLEVQQEKKGEVPPACIEGVTRGLFDDRRKNAPDEAAQALSALLGFTASASFGPDGPNFEINKSGARKMSKAKNEGEG